MDVSKTGSDATHKHGARNVVFLLCPLFLIPFLWLFPSISPDKHNYYAIYAIVLVPIGLFHFLTSLRRNVADPVTLFWLWVFMNLALVATNPLRTDFSSYIFPIIILSSYLFIRSLDSTAPLIPVLHLLFVLLAFEGALGIVQSLTSWPHLRELELESYQSERNYFAIIFPSVESLVVQGTGTFEHFNGLGSLLGLGAPVAWGFWSARKEARGRVLLLLLVLGGVVASFSRGALLGSVTGIWLFSLGMKKDGNSRKRFLMRTLIVATAFVMVYLVRIQDYYTQSENLSSRQEIWDIVYSYLVEQPAKLLFGFGYLFFHSELPTLGAILLDVHSSFLQVLAELGILGFVLLAVSLVLPLSSLYYCQGDSVVLALSAGILSFCVHQSFENSLFNENGCLMFCFIGFVRCLRLGLDRTAVDGWWYGEDKAIAE